MSCSPRQREILRSSATVLATEGYRRTTMGRIAAGAGITRAALYLHWSTKAQFYSATVAQAVSDRTDVVRTLLDRHDLSAGQRLAAAVTAWLDQEVGGWTARDLSDLPPEVANTVQVAVLSDRASLAHAVAHYAGEVIGPNGVAGAKSQTELTAARACSPSCGRADPRHTAEQFGQTVLTFALGLKLQTGSPQELSHRLHAGLAVLGTHIDLDPHTLAGGRPRCT